MVEFIFILNMAIATVKSANKLFLAFSMLIIIGCSYDEQLVDEKLVSLRLETLPPVADPADNISTPEKINLGKMLFWDPVLSGEKDVSCATCHHPNHGYGDDLDVAIGVGGEGVGASRKETASDRIPRVGRNSPTIINAAYNGLLSETQMYNPMLAPMFWDGRLNSLENQSLGPPTSYNEMRGEAYQVAYTYDTIVQRLKSIPEYVQKFSQVFSQGGKSISKENIGKAIASFERTIVSNDSRYDQYVFGNKEALSEEEKNGLILFYGKANCSNCHSGPMFSDYNYYNLGIEVNSKIGTDKGLGEAYEFRTPTLRNVGLTGPYMHNGTHETLQEVMDYYNDGVSESDNIRNIDSKIKPLGLSNNEIRDIILFMEALTDDSFDKSIPSSVPSGLKPGGNI